MNNALKRLQKATGLKVGKYDNDKNRIYNMCQMSIIMLEGIWKEIEELGLKDEQMVLDWLDHINDVSIRN